MYFRGNFHLMRPLIGVFINKKFLTKRKMILFARKLDQANERIKCSVYFFTCEEIDWEKETISGYVLDDSKKQWLVRHMPFPDIIYDRGSGFGRKETAAVEALRTRFKKLPDIQFINSCKLEKWLLHQRLSKYEALNRYLPATTLSGGIDDIRAMTTKYGYLFLKSSGGSGGRDVFAIEKSEDGFCYHYYHQGIHHKRNVSHLDSLGTVIKKIGLKPDQVIIQQGVRLIKLNNRPLDLRVLMVKDKNGIWNAVYNQARVAPQGAVITNTSLGGTVKDYSQIYSALKNRYPEIPSDKQIKDICMTIAHYIEKEFGPFGEMGIDIGVDENYKVWLLEANSKPSKLPEQKIEDTVGISPQFLMTLEYARFLYKQKET